MVICVYRSNPKAIESLVPEPLQPAPGALVYAWQTDFQVLGVGSYHEAVISLPVEFQGKSGQYMAYLYLDSDTAIAAGREIWGFPKKYARFPSSVREDILTKKVERGGVELFKISLQSMKPGKKEDLVALRNPIFNLKIIPSVRKGAPADVMQLTATTLQNFIVHRVMEGSATIEFGRSTADPVYLLQTIEVIKGLYCELDFDLPHGEVIYEYGEPPKEKRSAASS